MTVLMCVAGAFNDRGRWSVFRDVCSLVLPQGLEGLGGLVSPHVSKNTLWDPIQRLKCAYLCVRLHDAAAARQARGYYWPAGLLGRPVVSERSNICGPFVCRDRFSFFCLTSFSLFFPPLSVSARERLMLHVFKVQAEVSVSHH